MRQLTITSVFYYNSFNWFCPLKLRFYHLIGTQSQIKTKNRSNRLLNSPLNKANKASEQTQKKNILYTQSKANNLFNKKVNSIFFYVNEKDLNRLFVYVVIAIERLHVPLSFVVIYLLLVST